jgi:uncharacterized membrane protein
MEQVLKPGRNKEKTMRYAWGIVAALVALLSMTQASYAQFRVCNRSDSDEVYVALALASGPSGWQSEGWYTVMRGTCSTVVPQELHNRYYYLYAESEDTVWDGVGGEGGTAFCIREGDAFKLDEVTLADTRDDLQCEKRGYTTRTFLQIDTEEAASYTYELEE